VANTAVTIRRARPADAVAIVRMIAALCRQHQDPEGLFDLDHVKADLFGPQACLRGEVAAAGDAAIGVALWYPAYESAFAARGAFVESLWVDEPYRRRGVATALIAAVASAAEPGGATFLWWASKPGNEAAHATYASWGASSERVFGHALVGAEFDAMVARARKKDRPT